MYKLGEGSACLSNMDEQSFENATVGKHLHPWLDLHLYMLHIFFLLPLHTHAVYNSHNFVCECVFQVSLNTVTTQLWQVVWSILSSPGLVLMNMTWLAGKQKDHIMFVC